MLGFSNRSAVSYLVLASAIAFAAMTGAAATEATKPKSDPVGAGWESRVKGKDGQTGTPLSAEQMRSIAAVNKYFNELGNLSGRFTQTNPDNKVQKGKFYLKRPGRFRFDYNRPSRQIIVSDGTLLAIQDLDLKTDDTYSLENTPFRVLLRENVDILRDGQILQVQQSDAQIAVSLTDKSPDSPGRITIYLATQPEPSLAGWMTTDVQGGVTKVEVSDLARPEKLDRKLFEREKLFMRSIQ